MTAVVADSSDSQFIALMVKSLHDNGSYLDNPNLGAPFGQQFYDFPTAVRRSISG